MGFGNPNSGLLSQRGKVFGWIPKRFAVLESDMRLAMKSFVAKDGSGEPPSPGRNGERHFHGEQRSNETHSSTTDPEAKLAKKGQNSLIRATS